jgi:hypothetical protein
MEPRRALFRRSEPTVRHLIAARLAVLAIGIAFAGSAAAQADRTWVSGVGDDANPCTRTVPCKTFAGAISKTAAGGEIDALDSAGFGAVTITKSITLDGGATLASVLASGTSGIIVNGTGVVVVLRRLSITDVNALGTNVGISFLAGAALHVEDCKVSGFDRGIAFTPAAGGHLYASDVELLDNKIAGIALSSGSAATPSVATLTRVRLSHNGIGLQVQDNARASVYDSAASANASTAVSAAPKGTGAAEVNLEHVALSGSPLAIQAAGLPQGSAIVRFSKVVALDDGATAQADANARLVSFGNNRFLDPAPGPGNFAVAAAPGSAQVKAGQSAQFTVTVAPGTGVADSVALACANLPAGASCSFNPATVALAGNQASAALTVSTSTAGAMLGSAIRGPNLPNSIWLLAACMLLGFLAARRRGATRILPWAALCAAGFLASCNHSGGSGGGSTSVLPGTYLFQVTGTAADNAVRNLADITLTVTP